MAHDSLLTQIVHQISLKPVNMYDQLDRSKNQIRLLRLSPGCASDVLMCDLFTVSMEEPNEYEALSYVWGSAGNVLPIVLDGQRKDVTENLESALRHLRNAEKQRVLWVDALCINQDDLEERVSQVQLMRQIYSGASQVVVWLRSNKDKDEPALDMIRRLGSDPRLHWTAIPMKKGMELLSLYMCIKSEWWSRIWTAQEAVLARRTVYQLGTVRLPGRLLINLATSYREHVHRTGCCNTVKKPWKYGSRIEVADDLRRIMDNMFQLRQLQLAPHTLNFDEVASMFRHRTATDTRDKVYGLLGISCGIAEGSIDYTITQARVYELATRDCMSHNKNLNILSHVIQHVRVGPAGWAVCREKDEPSWVPDWTHGDTSAGSDVELTHYRANFLHHYNACGMLAYEPSLNDAVGKLHIRGTCCDTIATLSNAVLVRPLFLPTDQIKDWRSMVGLEEDPGRAYVGGDTVSEAFWRMLCLDIHVHSAPREDMATVVKRAGAENRELYLTHW